MDKDEKKYEGNREMTSETMLMLDNIKLWKDNLDKDEDKICNGMTELERRAY